ncbi:lysine-specific demethylase JMJ25 [Salvia hispanica]|uniref:lysine-specific demethylase JMJ25 n=1 Tax=Salvia hispanica TaxID=49212 RepID=UPI002009805A|nr:lysine-specific demethylase JMJ25 [Salvia hispanica]XP_047946199.1 lysine-specific demethylase JMJ25 [Salvia hispanica]
MRDKDPVPEEFRCKRTDGRQWRCKRRAMDGKTLCDIHYLQGKHRQNKQKVPDSLKLERNAGKKREDSNGECSRRVTKLSNKPRVAAERSRRRGVSEALDETLKRMKLKRGDLQLELIRVFLQREVQKKKERELKESSVADETRVLPYGVMAISHSHTSLPSIRENHSLDVKIGDDSNTLLERHFRSKNIEPLPFSTMQVFPLTGNVKAKKIKKCHWCRGSKGRCLIKCLTCRKRFFCLDCIKERHIEKQEVKAECPACRGICGCKLCLKQKIRPNTNKESYGGGRKLHRKELLLYLIHMLFPVLKKVNNDQIIELETESKAAGKEESEIPIPQTKLGISASFCCNKCNASIVDYHRTCSKCSYKLCLSCSRELSERSLSGSCTLRSCKKRKILSSGDDLKVKQTISRRNSGGPLSQSMISFQNWETSEDGSIPCPPTDIGGCGDSLLDLRSIFPFNWVRDLEVKAEETLDSHHFQTADASVCCSLCNDSGRNDGIGEPKLQKEPSKRIGFNNNYLYSPTVKDLHQETLEHFQNHWGKGHPVVVRNVLRSNTSLCWDPIIMFSLYMEKKSSGSCHEGGMNAANCLDWCEVEIDRKRIFMGSLEKRTHASVQQRFLKFKAWLSSHLFQKHFPLHYNEILSSLPLPEYVNPVSGLLNVSVKLPKELSKHDLGPCIYFSYGGPEELMPADYLSRLCYESHDTVNILAYATDAPVSPEQIDKIESMMKKYKARDHHRGQSFSNSSDQKGKSSLQSEDTGESGLQDIGEKIVPPDGIENVPFYSSEPLKGQAPRVENGNMSDDSEYDDDASILCCGSFENSEDIDENFEEEDIESSCSSEDKQGTDCCGAQWDIFPRQDVPKLLEYLGKHSNELYPACHYPKHVHPVLDQNFFLDAYHKLRLKEEYDIQPWTFDQCPGEAVFIPAGCPYQVRKIKSCVNIVVDFISPENAAHCIQVNDEIRLLPTRHKAKRKVMGVEKMALHSISAAIEDLCNHAADQLK